MLNLLVRLVHYAKQRIGFELELDLDLDPIVSEKLSGFISAITRMHPISVSVSVFVWPWTH